MENDADMPFEVGMYLVEDAITGTKQLSIRPG